MLALSGNTVSHPFWKPCLVAVRIDAIPGNRFPKILVHSPQRNTVVCLRAANPLLALIDRPGSVRDFVIDGILTEPLNMVRLS